MLDNISDLITRLRNGYVAKLPFVNVKKTKITLPILDILQKLGFILGFEFVNCEVLRVFLIYYRNEPAIRLIRRVSKPSNRVYLGCDSLNRPTSNSNISHKFVILSTTNGIVSDIEARLLKKGGEVLFEVC